MSEPITSKSPSSLLEVEGHNNVDHAADLDEKARVADYKADAIEAENAEVNMGVLQAVRAYPMASLWAFVMSCTIVSCSLPPLCPICSRMMDLQLTSSQDYGVILCLPRG